MPMITIDGGTLSYDVSGAGPPIVFVAGLGEHGTYWMAQVAAFSSAFQVVTFDHGGLDARLRRLFTFRKRALYEQVGFDRRRASRMTPQKIAAARIGAGATAAREPRWDSSP